jgi:predicted acylesterase/phospholipase RssA
LGKIPTGDDECRFDFNTLETKIKELISQRLEDEDYPVYSNPSIPSQCRTFVVARMAGNVTAPPAIFRSYLVEGEPRTKCAIWQAARATTAAPTFFKSMSIDNPPPAIIYVDGGLGYNNPSHLAIAESRRIWGINAKVCLVSIGTGHQSATSIVDESQLETNLEIQKSAFQSVRSTLSTAAWQIPGWKTATKIPSGVLALLKMANALKSIATDTEAVNDILEREADQRFPYFRFNVERDVGDIGFEEWRKEHALTTHTVAYLRTPATWRKKRDCSKCLIDPLVFYRK